MKRSMILVGIAGLASMASGQSFSLSLVPSVTSVSPSGSFTMEVYGDADVGTHMLGGAFSLESNGECVSDMQWTSADWSQFNTDGGYAGNGDYNEIIFGQLIIPDVPPFDVPQPGSELGGLIGSFVVQLDPAIGDFSINFQLVAASPFSLETIDINTGESFQSTPSTISLGSATVSVIPSPSTLPLIGCAGLIAIRRRR